MRPVALITGGQQGIGLGIAEALAKAGFAVALASLAAADDAAVVAAIEKLGADARYFRHDLSDIGNVPALLDAVEAELGPVDCLVSNAGVPAKVRGDFLAQQVARRMLAREAGPYRSLIFVTSVSAAMVSVERAEYCISKAGAAMMARLFAVRLAPHGIGVFELRPGIIETGMTAAVRDRYTPRIEAGLVPAGRWGQPADIGSIVVPLATGRMAFANGAVIPVDGGLSIARL